LGYYNGKANQNLIPRVDDGVLQIGFPFADRDANFTNASKGVLKKIIYPTKGFSEFEYESGTEVSTLEYTKEIRTLFLNYNTPANSNIKMSHQVNTLQDPNSSTGTSILNTTQSVMVEISASLQGALSNQHKLKFTLDDLNSSNDFTGIIELENPNIPNMPIKSFHKLLTFSNLNNQGNYVLRLEYYREDLSPYPVYPNYLIASANVTFSTYTPLIKNKLGLRVKTIKDYSDTGVIADYKRYYYNTYANRSNSTDSQPFIKLPEYVSNEIHEFRCMTNPQLGTYNCVTGFKEGKMISSNSLNSIYHPAGNKYQYVTISYGGENFEGGGKELSFSVQNDTDLLTVLNPLATSIYNHLDFSKMSNTGRHNGELLDEKLFKIDAGNYSMLTQKTYSYIDIPSNSGYITNCFNSKIFLRNSCHRSDTSQIDEYSDMYSPNGTSMVPMEYNIRNIYFGSYNTYYDSHILNKTVTTNYFPGSSVVTIDEMFYDSALAGLPSRKQTTGSNGIILYTKYYYPKDLATEPFMYDLINANRFEVIKAESFNNNAKVSETKTLYAKDITTGNIVYPKYEYGAKFPNALPYLGMPIGTLEKKITYDQYDPKGNILQYTRENGTSTSIIYGYNRTLPLAKVENATYDQILTGLATSEATLQSLTSAPSILRSILPNAMMTSYTYTPLIGITSITDAKGLNSYYEYDSSNRLQFIKDQNLNILQKYCYNYLGQQTDCSTNSNTVTTYQNVLSSSSFTKQFCGSGFMGSNHLYSVPAGIYISTISQADANSQANNEIALNGQTFANENGTCIPSLIAPTGLTFVSATNSSITMSWIAVPGATGYKILRNGVVLGSSSATTGTLMGLSAGTAYNVQVLAYMGTVDGPLSSNVVMNTLLGPPVGLAFTNATASTLNFSWTALTGATGYKIYKNGIYATSVATTAGSLSGLAASTSYSVQIQAYSGSGDGALSSSVTMATTAPATGFYQTAGTYPTTVGSTLSGTIVNSLSNSLYIYLVIQSGSSSSGGGSGSITMNGTTISGTGSFSQYGQIAVSASYLVKAGGSASPISGSYGGSGGTKMILAYSLYPGGPLTYWNASN
jgi:hypothetical protein